MPRTAVTTVWSGCGAVNPEEVAVVAEGVAEVEEVGAAVIHRSSFVFAHQRLLVHHPARREAVVAVVAVVAAAAETVEAPDGRTGSIPLVGVRDRQGRKLAERFGQWVTVHARPTVP